MVFVRPPSLPLFVLAASAFALSGAGVARAQIATAHVALHDLRVEDRSPPAYLSDALDDHTTGVMRGFEVCFAERAAVVPELGGELRLRLWVSARQVIRVTPESTTLADEELVRCVKARLLAFRLPPAAPSAGATVRFRLVFLGLAARTTMRCEGATCAVVACGALGEPCCPAETCAEGLCTAATCAVPPPPPPPAVVRIDVVRARGGLDAAALASAFTLAPLEACVTEGLSGRLPISLTVSRAGRVGATLGRGTVTERRARTCLRSALVGQRLPSRRSATSARIEVAVGAEAATPRP